MHTLKRTSIFLGVLFTFLLTNRSAMGQTVNGSAFTPSVDSLKGKLLFITECHEVKTNFPEYLLIINQITGEFTSSDTLNVFIEAPFSLTYFINNYLTGNDRLLIDSVLRNDPLKIEFYFAIRKLKKNIRFIGTDFEYDHGNPGGRLEAFKLYFEQLKNVFAKSNIDLSVIKSFIYGIRVQGLEEADFYTFKKYIQKLGINQPDAVLKAKLKEANFVLSALQSVDKTEVRDKAYYSRMVDILKSGISIENSCNLMIFGSAHGNAYNEKCLYSKLNYAEDSPFKNKVAIFANIYLDCLSYGSYNTRSIVLENVGLYSGSKEDKEIIALIKKEFKPETENSLMVYKNNITSKLKDMERVHYWGIHYKVK